jgi:lysophospholipase L1-like esterase
MTNARQRATQRIWIMLASLFATLLLCEIAARIWVSARWTDERIEQLTTHSSVRGRFASHPYLPYVLNPGFADHNAQGFRGAALATQKPAGVRRIACVGASTTYGLEVQAEEANPSQLGALLRKTHGAWEVINAGVPGWLSSETLVDLELRVLPLQPDVVVILEGRNELFPQAYNDFKPDYTHYRRPGFNYSVSNYGHKELFGWSRLAMLACTLRGERFGWSEKAEHPLYGGIVWEHRPTTAEAARNLQDSSRMAPLQSNLESMIELCRARGILVVVCTMAFRSEKLAMDELQPDPQIAPILGQQVERNNELAREVAGRLGAQIVETARLAERPELFFDDCHMNAEGHRLFAQMVYDRLAPILDQR